MSASDRPGATGSHEGGGSDAAHLEATGDCRVQPLRTCVREAVESYFHHLDGQDASGLFALVMAEVEVPLLETVLAHTNRNQSRAAAMLGINRATLRKKLERYNLV